MGCCAQAAEVAVVVMVGEAVLVAGGGGTSRPITQRRPPHTTHQPTLRPIAEQPPARGVASRGRGGVHRCCAALPTPPACRAQGAILPRATGREGTSPAGMRWKPLNTGQAAMPPPASRPRAIRKPRTPLALVAPSHAPSHARGRRVHASRRCCDSCRGRHRSAWWAARELARAAASPHSRASWSWSPGPWLSTASTSAASAFETCAAASPSFRRHARVRAGAARARVRLRERCSPAPFQRICDRRTRSCSRAPFETIWTRSRSTTTLRCVRAPRVACSGSQRGEADSEPCAANPPTAPWRGPGTCVPRPRPPVARGFVALTLALRRSRAQCFAAVVSAVARPSGRPPRSQRGGRGGEGRWRGHRERQRWPRR